MVLTMKLTSFAYSLYDGSVGTDSSSSGSNDGINNSNNSSISSNGDEYNENNIKDKNNSSNSNSKTISSNTPTNTVLNSGENKNNTSSSSRYKNRIAVERAEFAISTLPSLIEFGGYVFCFPNLLAGPAFTYKDYITAIDSTVFIRKNKKEKTDEKVNGMVGSSSNNSSESKDNQSKSKDNTEPQPSSLLPALHRLLIGIISIYIYFFISSKAPISRQYDPVWQATHSFLYRLAFISISFLGERSKFYFAWKISEGACILGGFGFEGYKEEVRGEAGKDKGIINKFSGWRGVENIDIFAFETGTNIQSLSRAWNKRTQGWLERCIYQRTNRSLVLTYAVSALWHGLYPGYFLFFLTAALMSSVERLVRIKINPLILGADPSFTPWMVSTLYGLVCWILTSVVLTYHAQAFYMKTLERSIAAFKSFHFIPTILLISFYFILEILPSSSSSKSRLEGENNGLKTE